MHNYGSLFAFRTTSDFAFWTKSSRCTDHRTAFAKPLKNFLFNSVLPSAVGFPSGNFDRSNTSCPFQVQSLAACFVFYHVQQFAKFGVCLHASGNSQSLLSVPDRITRSDLLGRRWAEEPCVPDTHRAIV